MFTRNLFLIACIYKGVGRGFMVKRLEFIAVCLLIPLGCRAVELYDRFPDVVHANERYVIYAHGLIVEGDDPKPVSPKYGQYDFPGIKQALFEGGGFNLIAYQRPKGADFGGYVETLESWVRRLLDAGVSPHRITLVGFSRGGQTTSYASSDLASVGINTALLAICSMGISGVSRRWRLAGICCRFMRRRMVWGRAGSWRRGVTLRRLRKSPSRRGRGMELFFSRGVSGWGR